MRRLMAILAHPDDESLGLGGTLARYAVEGVETHVLTATRGEGGRHGAGEHPGREVLGLVREAELRAAAAELGVTDVRVLGYPDGALDGVDGREAVARMVEHVRRVRPHVVVTFDATGAYGHPDHVAVSQLTGAALVAAADPAFDPAARASGSRAPGGADAGFVGGPAPAADAPAPAGSWRVRKLYWMAWGPAAWERYQRVFKTLASTVDGTVRRAAPWPEWAITTRVDARPWWRTVWRAVRRHRTQMSAYEALADLPDELHERLWGEQTFYRVHSAVGCGRETETDLFEGLDLHGGEGA